MSQRTDEGILHDTLAGARLGDMSISLCEVLALLPPEDRTATAVAAEMVFEQAIRALLPDEATKAYAETTERSPLRERRKATKPRPAKPASIIAQVDDSG